ncbi:MAG: hypothetical protein HDS80_04980 [Bacteroidales bacterium]|nr:hypothetical protein [Bacteroidales bacterium]
MLSGKEKRKLARHSENGGGLHELYLGKLYRHKSFHILWRWLDHNMEKWWD